MGIWNTLIVQPISWVLLKLYEFFGSYGLAIILFTLIMKVILLPFTMKGKRGMVQQQRLQPKIKALEQQYKTNQKKYQEEVQKLYEKEGVSPMSGCLWTLLPWPIFIALYDAVRRPLTVMMRLLETQVRDIAALPVISEQMAQNGIVLDTAITNNQIPLAQIISQNIDAVRAAFPDLTNLIPIDFRFLGLDLSLTPSFTNINPVVILPILAAILSLASVLISQRTSGLKVEGAAGASSKFMYLLSPVMTIWIGFMWPAAMSLYWVANSVFGAIQDIILGKHYNRVFDKLDIEREKKEAERKRIEKERKAELARRRAEEPSPATSNKKKYKKKKTLPPPGQISGSDSDGADTVPPGAEATGEE